MSNKEINCNLPKSIGKPVLFRVRYGMIWDVTIK